MNASVSALPPPVKSGKLRTSRPADARTNHAPLAHQAKEVMLPLMTSSRPPSQLVSAGLLMAWTHATPNTEDFSIKTLLERLVHLTKAKQVKEKKVAKARAQELLRSLPLGLPSLLLSLSETFGPQGPAEYPLVLRTDSLLGPCTCHETTS